MDGKNETHPVTNSAEEDSAENLSFLNDRNEGIFGAGNKSRANRSKSRS